MARLITTAAFVCCFIFAAVLSQDDLCYDKVDILFIMDSSGSVGSQDFLKQLQFASTFVNNFPVGIAQFSVLRFDTSPAIIFDFNEYKDSASLKNAILKIPYPGGGTDTAAALKLAREKAFLPSGGARPGVPRIAIVTTDGQSNNPESTKIEAKNLKDSHVLVLTIGVGSSYYRPELEAIATYPEDILEVIDYDTLLSTVHDYSELVCNEVKLFDCHNDADVFFLLDSSSKITLASFQNERQYVTNLTSRFKLTEFHFGAATFGGLVKKLFHFTDLNNQASINQVILAATPVLGETDIDRALRYVSEQRVFELGSGGRVNATKVLVIFTDGGSINSAQAQATAALLRSAGITIVTVGVSSANIPELQALVEHPVLDVVTNLANPAVTAGRLENVAAYTECKVPEHAVQDVREACRLYNWENGIHPHPYDCTKFIECTYLKTDIMSCPPTQGYDPIIQTCNWIHLVAACSEPGAVVSTKPPTVISTTAKPCLKGQLDILFIIDSSTDIGFSGFGDEQRFAANLAENFILGPADVQFAAITFGNNPHELFKFNTYTEYKKLQSAILTATYQGGSPNTHLALENGLNFFDSSHGSRPGSPKIAIVFTNGRSTDSQRTKEQADRLKQAGIYVIAVGHANPNPQELQAIASSPSAVFYDDFSGVLKAVQAYSNITCGGDFECQGVQFADVIFVLDSSASISDPDYKSQLNFVAEVTEKFLLGPEDVQFGGVIFSHTTEKLFDLRDFNNHDTLRSAILSARHLKSGTDTARALSFVYEEDMFGSRAGGRVNTTKILIIMTDGRSNSKEETVKAAQRLKANEVKFIAIGIGADIYLDELSLLAGDNKSLFTVAGYSALAEIIDRVTRKTCELPKDPVEPSYTNLCSTYLWADGKHPNPYDCSTYVECKSFVTTIVYCLFGEAYDPIIQKCTDKSSAHPCNDSYYFGPTATMAPSVTSTTRQPATIDTSSLCAHYNLVDGIYPDPGSCTHFVECTNLFTYHMECPFGLHFNTLNSVCDDVHAVNCQLNYNYFNFRV